MKNAVIVVFLLINSPGRAQQEDQQDYIAHRLAGFDPTLGK